MRLPALLPLLVASLVLSACGSPDPGAPDGGVAPRDGGSRPASCTVTAPTACPSPAPRYADIAPVLQRHCVGCHSGVPNGPWPLTDYEHVSDWQHEIRADLLDCVMPPADAGTVMTTEERTAVLVWIRCGAPE